MENVNEKLLSDFELGELFYKWFTKVHPAKTNPKITAIQKNKIYFTYDGSTEDSLIHTKLLQDLFDRGKI